VALALPLRRLAFLWIVGLGAALVLLCGLESISVPGAGSSPSGARRSPQPRGTRLLPRGLAPAASMLVGEADQRFWVTKHDGSFAAEGGGIRSSFSASGVRLRSGSGSLDLRLLGVGHGSHPELAPIAPTASKSTVGYRRGSLTEWYRNGPYGLEQGFTLARRPGGQANSLTIELGLGGSLTPRGRGRKEVELLNHVGAVALRYGALTVSDAKGAHVPAELEVHGRRLLIRVFDAHAVYPLRIDPFIQQGSKIVPGDEDGSSTFGVSVALSADGNTALIGGEDDGGYTGNNYSGAGAAWIFTRSGETWTEQQKLDPDDAGTGGFGSSVALSADGNTALIGSGDANWSPVVGAAWVFTRTGTTWSEQQKLTATEELGKGDFGASVALSEDGNTALIGGYSDNTYVGGAWVFTRSGTTWAQRQKLTAHEETPANSEFGTSVALSGDGKTALIGDGDVTNFTGIVGAAWVFARSGEAWSQQGAELTANDESGNGGFGHSVALTGDGDTALIGGPADNSGVGAAWVFTPTAGTWTQQGSKLVPDDETEKSGFGSSIALSADGNTALIGGIDDHGERGAAWVFTPSAGTWTQQGSKLTDGEEAPEIVTFGLSVALSSDAGTALIGGPGSHNNVGAAWVFGSGESEHTPPVETPKETPSTTGGSTATGGASTTTVGSSASTAAAGASPGIASTPKAVEELLLGCSKHSLVLNDVLIRGGRVVLSGSAANSLAGKKVKIVFDAGKPVATTTVQANGQFSTTAPLPPARLRNSNSARYLAESGSQRSLNLKLTRRLSLEPPTFSGDSVTLAGQVVPPLRKPIAPVTVEEQLECGKTSKVMTFTPSATGRFHVTIPGIPAGAKAGIYRLMSSVAQSPATAKHGFATSSLPLPVALG
jgi:hypothetical protein